jgi:hypothetical protein
MDIVFAIDTPFVWKAEKELRDNREALITNVKDANEVEHERRQRRIAGDPGNVVDAEKPNGNGWTNHSKNV